MTIEEILQTSLDHPDINKACYLTDNPTQIEKFFGGDQMLGYLITHETENIEVCLTTSAKKAFAPCRKTGAAVKRNVDCWMCREVESYFRKEGFETID